MGVVLLDMVDADFDKICLTLNEFLMDEFTVSLFIPEKINRLLWGIYSVEDYLMLYEYENFLMR